MPVLLAPRDTLFRLIGKKFSDEDFDELCFSFGIELDEITSEKKIIAKETHSDAVVASDEILYKIEIPANRYDLLSTEGLAIALRNFLSLESCPNYHLDIVPWHHPTSHEPLPIDVLHVSPSVAQVRPFVFAAILRDVDLDNAAYDSFIKMQDKLHQTLARNRTLASVGTHDYDTIQGPFTYEALPPSEIEFVPLNQSVSVNGANIPVFYEHDLKIRQYLGLLTAHPLYPVILDKNRSVCSLPPLINSNLSKISPSTKNIFIEVTATDAIKGEMFLKTLVASFSYYCKKQYTVVPVKVVYSSPDVGPFGKQEWILDLSMATFTVESSYVNKLVGVSLSDDEIISSLSKMLYSAIHVSPGVLSVGVAPSRTDVMHPCDIVEDVAIQYGFKNIPHRLPTCATVSEPFKLNKLSDSVRLELALAGFIEALTLTLCSFEENGPLLRQPHANLDAVELSNPTTAEYQVVRTSLLPGLLKMLNHNRAAALPLRLFEVSDVVLKDKNAATGARNERRIAAVYCGLSSGFEIIHGTLDRFMKMLAVKACHSGKLPENASGLHYTFRASDHPTYFAGRSVDIVLLPGEQVIGTMGVIHPEVLCNFGIANVSSAFELNLEPFL